MTEIITIKNEIAECDNCRHQEFEIIAQAEYPTEPMAFCVNCNQGKAVSLYQFYWKTGTMSKSEFEAKHTHRSACSCGGGNISSGRHSFACPYGR